MVEQAEVRDNLARHRFELVMDHIVAFSAYKMDGDILVFTHTVVPPELEGKGVGSRLVSGALAMVRARGVKIRPDCPFVRAYIDRHPEWQDLLA